MLEVFILGHVSDTDTGNLLSHCKFLVPVAKNTHSIVLWWKLHLEKRNPGPVSSHPRAAFRLMAGFCGQENDEHLWSWSMSLPVTVKLQLRYQERNSQGPHHRIGGRVKLRKKAKTCSQAIGQRSSILPPTHLEPSSWSFPLAQDQADHVTTG